MIETSGLQKFKAYDFFRKSADVPPNILKAVTPLNLLNHCQFVQDKTRYMEIAYI